MGLDFTRILRRGIAALARRIAYFGIGDRIGDGCGEAGGGSEEDGEKGSRDDLHFQPLGLLLKCCCSEGV